MKPILTLVFLVTLFVSPLARGQAVLNKTTLGQSQNDDADLVNSLVPGPQKYGKGEKKAVMNSTDLKSKTLKDSTFGGSLLNMGIDPSVPKLDETKLRNAQTETDEQSTAVKQQAAANEKQSTAAKQPATVEKEQTASTQRAESESTFSSLSQTAILADQLSRSDSAAAASEPESKSSSASSSTANGGDNSKKDQGGASTSADKSSTPKPDADR